MQLTYRDINVAYEQLLKQKEIFRRMHHLALNYKIRLDRYLEEHEDLLQLPVKYCAAYLVAIIGHLAFAVTTAVIAMPLLEEILSPLEENGALLVPILGIYGLSSSVGLLIHRVEFRKSSVRTGGGEYAGYYLAAAVLGVLLYISILGVIILAGEQQLKQDEGGWTTTLILMFGIGELFVAYFALTGWGLVTVNLRIAYKRFRLQRLEIKKQTARVRMHLQKAYHSQYLHLIHQKEQDHGTAFASQVGEEVEI